MDRSALDSMLVMAAESKKSRCWGTPRTQGVVGKPGWLPVSDLQRQSLEFLPPVMPQLHPYSETSFWQPHVLLWP